MNTVILCRGFWTAAVLAGLGVASLTVATLAERGRWQAPVASEALRLACRGPRFAEEPRRDLVDRDLVERGFHRMDWTGVLPPPPEPGVSPADPPGPRPVAELLRIVFLRIDSASHRAGFAFVRFLDPELARAAAERARRSPAGVLHPGDRLPPPSGGVRVAAVEEGGVLFVFDDPARPPEWVAPSAQEVGGGLEAALR